jgi:hypothetical protein
MQKLLYVIVCFALIIDPPLCDNRGDYMPVLDGR